MAPARASVSIDIPSDVFFGSLLAVLVLFFLVVTTLLIVQLARTWSPRHRAKAVAALSRTTNLAVPDSLREPLAHYLAIRSRGALIAGLITLPVFLLALRPWADPPPSVGLEGGILGFAVISGATLIGTLIGTVWARRTAIGSERVARITELDVSDLVAPVERRLLRVCLIAGIGLPALLVIAMSAPWVQSGFVVTSGAPFLLVAGLASAATSVLLPRIARRLVATRAIAGDEHSLAWSDALAARTLREVIYLLVSVSGTAALIALLSLAFALPDDWMIAAMVWGNLAFYVCIAAIVTVVVVVSVRTPDRHVQRTLWPQFAADAQ